MTYVVVDNCIKCKYMDCISVCPVDCFYEGDNMLVINPDECIDCGVCEPECPADAIRPHTDKREDLTRWLKLNDEYSRSWPQVTKARPHDPSAAGYDGEPHKLEKYFSALPGRGD